MKIYIIKHQILAATHKLLNTDSLAASDKLLGIMVFDKICRGYEGVKFKSSIIRKKNSLFLNRVVVSILVSNNFRKNRYWARHIIKQIQ